MNSEIGNQSSPYCRHARQVNTYISKNSPPRSLPQPNDPVSRPIYMYNEIRAVCLVYNIKLTVTYNYPQVFFSLYRAILNFLLHNSSASARIIH